MVLYRPPFPESGLRAKYHNAPLNSVDGEIKDLARPYVRSLIDAKQGGVSRHIMFANRPARPGLADAFRAHEALTRPDGAKFGGRGRGSPPGHRAGIRTRNGFYHGPERSVLCEYRMRCRSGVRWEIGIASRARCPDGPI